MRPKLYHHALKGRVSKRNLYAAADLNEGLQVRRHEVGEDAIEVTRENDVNQRRIG
jgi:hypothetical protein